MTRILRYLYELLIGIFFISFASTAVASNITVNSLADGVVNNGNCTLREAILAANSDSTQDACTAGNGADVIQIEVPGTIRLIASLPTVTQAVTINGVAATATIIDGRNEVRPFVFDSPGNNQSFTLSRLTVTGGLADSDAALSQSGGGILLETGDALTISHAIVTGNLSYWYGGGINVVENAAGLTVEYSTISDNAALRGGGIATTSGGNVTILNSTVNGNTAFGEGGGGLAAVATQTGFDINLIIERSTFDSNSTRGNGGGLLLRGSSIALAKANIKHLTLTKNIADMDYFGFRYGGGVFLSRSLLQLENSVVAENMVSTTANDIYDSGSSIGNSTNTVLSHGFNLIGVNNEVVTAFPVGTPNVNQDFVGNSAGLLVPGLKDLDDNDGPTSTRSPGSANSMVVDQGKCTGETEDQRGYGHSTLSQRVFDVFSRPNATGGDGCDIGAVEFDSVQHVSFEQDSDSDGVNNVQDAYPFDANQTTSVDSDNDGVTDNMDAFPNDDTETLDTDDDGVGDNADIFPFDPSEGTDTDGDGVGDNADFYPYDPLRSGADDIIVDTLVDEVPTNNGNCTLREAILASSNNVQVDACPPGDDDDRIVFGVRGVIILKDALPLIQGGNLEISGPGANQLVIAGNDFPAGNPGSSAYWANHAGMFIFQGHNVITQAPYEFKLKQLKLANGEYFNDGSTVTGEGGGCMVVTGGASLTLEYVELESCASTNVRGGGLYFAPSEVGARPQLSIHNSSFHANKAGGSGGGVYVFADADVSITGSTFSDNLSGSLGGGLAIAPQSSNGASLLIENSTFHQNMVQGFMGGAIAFTARGGLTSVIDATIQYSTIVENGAHTQVLVNPPDLTSIPSCSIEGAGIGSRETGLSLHLANNIIDANKDFDFERLSCSDWDLYFNLNFSPASLTTGGGNWIRNYAPGAGDSATLFDNGSPNAQNDYAGPGLASPQLSPLSNYGGPTTTRPPLTGSPLIDSGNCGIGVRIDQRGYGKSMNQIGLCDIGAVETGATLLVDIDNDDVDFAVDNCPFVTNADQADNNGFEDGDGIGDACEFLNTDPELTSPSPNSTLSGASETFSWTANYANVSAWWLYIGTSAGAFDIYDSGSLGTSTSHTVTDLPTDGSVIHARLWYLTAVQGWQSVDYTYTASHTTLPGKANLLTPSGNITDNTPTYSWDAVAGSTWYYLWVDDSSGNKIKQWYTAAAVGCASGTGTCTITPTTALANGGGQWWIQTWNTAGYGPWSTAMNFTVSATPAVATLITPSGTISDTTPTYTWNAVSGSTWYYLWVDDATGNKIKQWYTAATAGCASGTGTCSITPTTALADGAGQWWIQTWNAAGYGPWSAPLNFNVAP